MPPAFQDVERIQGVFQGNSFVAVDVAIEQSARANGLLRSLHAILNFVGSSSSSAASYSSRQKFPCTIGSKKAPNSMPDRRFSAAEKIEKQRVRRARG
jgi:hypothetical protein